MMRRRALAPDLAVEEPGFPRVVRAALPGVDLADWAGARAERLAAALLADGAVLYRGFALGGAAAVERAATILLGPLERAYPELERAGGDAAHYRPTPYPPAEVIPFHNEAAHRRSWPARQAFACLAPAASGGETPIADGRRVWRALPADLADRLARRGLRYTRRFVPGLDVGWADFFGSDDRASVEILCRDADIDLAWTAGGAVASWSAPAVRPHAATGEVLPFHQILTHHPATLPARLRAALAGETPPRDVGFGDGSPIPEEDVTRLAAVYQAAAVSFAWQPGDLLVIDNHRVAHGRNCFTGPRSLLVALSR